MIGETVGNYKVIAQLGEGGMGLVYLAEHPLIGSKVAIKVLHKELSNNPEVVSRFFTEARSVNDIRHPNIVEIADFGDKDGRCYIVMEFLEGESLATRMRRVGTMDERTAARVCMRVASALGAAHNRGIVHRDLKPDNVFLTVAQGQPEGVRVLDFGIAKLVGDPFQTSHRTQTGVVIGTPFYMSPEQCLAKKDLDGRSDIYALGVLMYELVTGSIPFPFESLGELIVAHTSQTPPPPKERNPRVSAEMSQIIMRCLEKAPGARFQTMGELVEILAPIAGLPISGQFISTMTIPPTSPGATTPAPIAPTTLSSAAGARDVGPDDDKLPTKSRVPLIAGGVAVIAAAVVAVVMMKGGGSGDGESAGQPAAAAQPAPADATPTPAEPPAAEPPVPTVVAVEVSSTPEAELFIRDINLGVTPVSVDVPPDGSVEVELRSEGYETKRVEVKADAGDKLAVTLEKSKRTTRRSKSRTSKKKEKKEKKESFTVKPIE